MVKKKIISCLRGVLAGCFLAVCGVSMVQAAELSDGFTGENAEAKEQVVGMDEDANVFVLEEDSVASVNEGIAPCALDDFFVNFATKSSTETTSYTEAETGTAGYVCGKYGADAIYLGTESDGKIRFMMGGVIGLVNASEVELVSKDAAVSYNYYEVVGGKLIHRITTNMYSSSYSSSLNNGPAPDYLETGVKYFSYDGHYFYTDLDVMVSDYRAEHRDNAVNSSDPFYNYFQYLPLRSYTSYSKDELTDLINARVKDGSKMKDLGSALVENQDEYGTNALLVAGVAANESAWGMSNICQSKNNLFGINAIDSTPGQSSYYYPSPEACVKDYTQHFLSEQYLNPNNWKFFGAFLGNKASGMNVKYASDPYWGEKAAAVAWQLDENGGNQDQYIYTLGVKDMISSDHTNLNIRKEATTASDIIYKTKAQSNHTFIILDTTPVNNFYMVRSEPVLKEDRSGIASGIGTYDKSYMYLYASCDYITIISQGTGIQAAEHTWGEWTVVTEPTYDAEGLRERTCKDCGKTETERIEQLIRNPFTDVKEDYFFYEPVLWAVENGVTDGTSDTTFSPFASCSRGQVVTFLWRAAGSPEPTSTANPFKDVTASDYYYKAVLWAVEKGITQGTASNKFSPKDTCTRAHVVTFLYRLVGEPSVTAANPFKDVPGYAYYVNAVLWAVDSGITDGITNTTFEPDTVCNRGTAVTFLYRAFGDV